MVGGRFQRKYRVSYQTEIRVCGDNDRAVTIEKTCASRICVKRRKRSGHRVM